MGMHSTVQSCIRKGVSVCETTVSLTFDLLSVRIPSCNVSMVKHGLATVYLRI